MLRGNHTITVGTHNEFFKFKNLFLAESFGYYYFPTLDAFEAGHSRRAYTIRFYATSNPLGRRSSRRASTVCTPTTSGA